MLAAVLLEPHSNVQKAFILRLWSADWVDVIRKHHHLNLNPFLLQCTCILQSIRNRYSEVFTA
nr:hypothetical protein Iba_scaffold39160CG0020 [Ipomoea batatas]GMD31189.1 hypothetical protein Iba_scaffold84303CG0020 [Ipomoea batatas]GME00947.1 hypothetical protein Iba_scaffold1676206CG0010 [Ipomoea batatas]